MPNKSQSDILQGLIDFWTRVYERENGDRTRVTDRDWQEVKNLDGYTDARCRTAQATAYSLWGWNNDRKISEYNKSKKSVL